jgi:hypothetical protein
MVKYKQIFNEMIQENKAVFADFKKLHDQYAQDEKKWKTDFDREGQKILLIVKRYENRLCGRSENSGYGKFSSGLTDKFWGEVKTLFPLIEFVGAE